MKTINYLSKNELLEKWGAVLDAAGGISDASVRLSTAQVLENTQNDKTAGSLVAEEMQTGGAPFGTGTNLGTGANDVRWPSIVIPTVRRIFPELTAHELFGVQPMSSSLGYAFAIRARRDVNGTFESAGTDDQNSEIGYNTLATDFTGASASTMTASGVSDMWAKYNGSLTSLEGTGATLGDSEGATVGVGTGAGTYPMAKIDLVKGAVEAKSRKLAANWSPELAEDLANQHGVDVDAEMTEILTYEVQSGIDRQLVTTAVKAAINGGMTSNWSPVSADGRNQIERIGTILTQVIIKSNEVARQTRRGSANWCVASSRVSALLERLNNVPMVQGNTMPTLPVAGVGALNKVGLINSGKQLLLRDTFAGGEYMLLGYKGQSAQDAGIVYCPYIPMQLMRAIKDADFSPEIGVRTRYGIFTGYQTTDSKDADWAGARYYQFIGVDGLTDSALQSDTGSRVFTM